MEQKVMALLVEGRGELTLERRRGWAMGTVRPNGGRWVGWRRVEPWGSGGGGAAVAQTGASLCGTVVVSEDGASGWRC